MQDGYQAFVSETTCAYCKHFDDQLYRCTCVYKERKFNYITGEYDVISSELLLCSENNGHCKGFGFKPSHTEILLEKIRKRLGF
jgi:hypothetical protein